MSFLSRLGRAPAPAPAPAAGSVEAELVAACQAADEASQALAAALAARRAAIVRMTAQTRLAGKCILTRLLSPSATWAALAHHGAAELIALPHVVPEHRRTFQEAAAWAISSSAVYRPAPAAPGMKEAADAAQ